MIGGEIENQWVDDTCHCSMPLVVGGVYVGTGHDVKSGDMIKVRHGMEIVQYDSTDVVKGEVNSKREDAKLVSYESN